MTAEDLVHTVRGRLGLGRLLPLGRAADGAWIAERAAVGVLRAAERAVPGARLEAMRIGLAEPDGHDWAAVRAANPAAPPSALPPGPLRIEADLAADPAAGGGRPLTLTADALRGALAAVARERLGLAVEEIDLRVTDLLEPGPPGTAGGPPVVPGGAEAVRSGPPAGPVAFGAPAEATAAASMVPGVAALTARLAGPVGGAGDAVLVQIAVDGGHRALDVARAVRAAVAAVAATAGRNAPATAVVVTDVV